MIDETPSLHQNKWSLSGGYNWSSVQQRTQLRKEATTSKKTQKEKEGGI